MTSLLILGAAHVHLPDHLKTAEDEGVSVSHVFDRDPERAKACAGENGAEPVEHLDALGDLGVDGVICCSETVHHEADISAALKAGLPVFTEKPLAGSKAEAERLAALAGETGVRLDTGYFLRTQPALRTLHEAVKGGALGAIHEGRARFSHDGGYADWLDVTGWMTDPELTIYGGFGDESVHAIDQLLWMLGAAKSAKAELGNTLGFKVDDHGVALMIHEGGARSSVQGGWTDPFLRFELELIGEAGWARVDGNRVEHYERGRTDPVWRAQLADFDAGEGSRPFLQYLKTGQGEPVCTPGEAAAVNAALDLCYGAS
ncbi:MAG: Gfo/Idh/MocA family oxidoreductase [Oceanicaulis sp.]